MPLTSHPGDTFYSSTKFCHSLLQHPSFSRILYVSLTGILQSLALSPFLVLSTLLHWLKVHSRPIPTFLRVLYVALAGILQSLT